MINWLQQFCPEYAANNSSINIYHGRIIQSDQSSIGEFTRKLLVWESIDYANDSNTIVAATDRLWNFRDHVKSCIRNLNVLRGWNWDQTTCQNLWKVVFIFVEDELNNLLWWNFVHGLAFHFILLSLVFVHGLLIRPLWWLTLRYKRMKFQCGSCCRGFNCVR